MCKRTFNALATLTSAVALFSCAPYVFAAPPPGLSNNSFPPSFYGFNPGYYGPYYPGQYRYGNVNPPIYSNPTYPMFSGSGRSNTVPVPYSAQSYGSSPTASTPSGYMPPVSSYGYGVPYSGPPLSSARAQRDTTILAEVHLPTPDAELWVEGRKTASTGTWRQFLSPPLLPGERYVYEFRTRWYENGREVNRTREVPVRAGERIIVDFTRSASGV